MLTYFVKSQKFHDMDQKVKICKEIEQVARHFSLEVVTKTTLRSKKGSYHWHLKQGNKFGVLEMT